MANTRDLLNEKGNSVHAVRPDASVLEAAALMNHHGVGALVVTEGEQLVGIITERDVLRRIVTCQRDPANTTVSDIMTREVICTDEKADLEELRSIMKQQRVRHLPVVDHTGKCVGMISIGDLNGWQLNGQEQTIHYLQEYIYGASA